MAQVARQNPDDLPSVPDDITATRAHDDSEKMLVHSLEHPDQWIQGLAIDPMEID